MSMSLGPGVQEQRCGTYQEVVEEDPWKGRIMESNELAVVSEEKKLGTLSRR